MFLSLFKSQAANKVIENGNTSGVGSIEQTSHEKGRFDSIGVRLGRYRLTALLVLCCLVAFGIQRLVLFAIYVEAKSLTGWELLQVFLTGFEMDLLVSLVLVMPQSVRFALMRERPSRGRLARGYLTFECVFLFVLVAFVCIAEIVFFAEFQSRLNYIAFEYLVYPHEVFVNIWETYPVLLLLGLVGGLVAGFLWITRSQRREILDSPTSWPQRWGTLGIVALGIVLLASSVGLSSTNVSENRVANECAGNGFYSFAYYAWTCRFDYEDFYQTIDEQEAITRLRRRIFAEKSWPEVSSTNPVDRWITSPFERNWNVVLILEESLGSDYVGVLGDERNLTPQFDGLSREGILLDNFYATGNRTARALEAVLTSMPPLPTEAILKRDHNDRVYTLPRVLADRGYRRVFVTGGRGIFDGMRSFTLANGFERFIEQSDYPNPTHVTAWGVSDEEIFAKALDTCNSLYEQGSPFFMTILSISNHHPFTYPKGRIDLPPEAQRRIHAVKYADWALGEFFRQARSRAFYQNTLFVVMGDHGARVYGSQMFPLKSYQIPVLILRPDQVDHGQRISTLGCSMDIAPTVLGLLGGTYRSVFFGRDIFQTDADGGYALMQHNHDLALLESDGRMLVLGSQKKATQYQFDGKAFALRQRKEPDDEFRRDTIAFYQLAQKLYYEDRWFPAQE